MKQTAILATNLRTGKRACFRSLAKFFAEHPDFEQHKNQINYSHYKKSEAWSGDGLQIERISFNQLDLEENKRLQSKLEQYSANPAGTLASLLSITVAVIDQYLKAPGQENFNRLHSCSQGNKEFLKEIGAIHGNLYNTMHALGKELRSSLLSIPEKYLDEILAASSREEALEVFTRSIKTTIEKQ